MRLITIGIGLCLLIAGCSGSNTNNVASAGTDDEGGSTASAEGSGGAGNAGYLDMAGGMSGGGGNHGGAVLGGSSGGGASGHGTSSDAGKVDGASASGAADATGTGEEGGLGCASTGSQSGGGMSVGTPGQWTDVTPLGVDLTNFGLGYIVLDPTHASDLYVGGTQGLFKSSNFGVAWSKINDLGGIYTLAIANDSADTAATLWGGTGEATGTVRKSTDGGATWINYGGGLVSALYSIQVDPCDSHHLISGLHEAAGIVESTDGGVTWKLVPIASGMASGASWYPFFINTGRANTTRTRWIAMPQMTGGEIGTWLTTNGGTAWSRVQANEHPHGNSQIYLKDGALFIAGVYGTEGWGVYRSTDLGATFSHVGGGQGQAIVWGSPTKMYAMYGWAAGTLGDFSPAWQIAAQPGETGWMNTPTPAAMKQGPSSESTTFDGTHYVFVASMWNAGLWRYVEP